MRLSVICLAAKRGVCSYEVLQDLTSVLDHPDGAGATMGLGPGIMYKPVLRHVSTSLHGHVWDTTGTRRRRKSREGDAMRAGVERREIEVKSMEIG